MKKAAAAALMLAAGVAYLTNNVLVALSLGIAVPVAGAPVMA